MGAVAIGFLIVTGLIFFGKKTRFFEFFTLKAEITGTAGGADPDEKSPEDYSALIGKSGIAVSTLRPVGKAKIEDKVYPVETEGDYIEKDEIIKVIHIFGNRIVVKK
jgi:membrane-bound serine protease (ClpP class)